MNNLTSSFATTHQLLLLNLADVESALFPLMQKAQHRDACRLPLTDNLTGQEFGNPRGCNPMSLPESM